MMAVGFVGDATGGRAGPNDAHEQARKSAPDSHVGEGGRRGGGKGKGKGRERWGKEAHRWGGGRWDGVSEQSTEQETQADAHRHEQRRALSGRTLQSQDYHTTPHSRPRPTPEGLVVDPEDEVPPDVESDEEESGGDDEVGWESR